jgi:tetratricopeptide (TPR) repeat protein
MSNTLTHLGTVHQNRREFDLALDYHTRALALHNEADVPDQTLIANSLIGIADAQWGRRNLSEALDNAERALALHQSQVPINEANLAMNYAILANIYHDFGDDVQALELCTQALSILERSESANSLQMASVLNNLGAIQLSLGAISEARNNFDRAFNISAQTLPHRHPKSITMEDNLRFITQIQQSKKDNLQSQS